MSRSLLKGDEPLPPDDLFHFVQQSPTEENMREFQQHLRDNPTSVNVTNSDGQTALFFAREEYVPSLIAAHADVNHKDDLDVTPLIVAAHQQTPNKIKMLLKAGADPLERSMISMGAHGTALDFAKSDENFTALLISDVFSNNDVERIFRNEWGRHPDFAKKFSELMRERALFRRRHAVIPHAKILSSEANIWGGGRRGRSHRRRRSSQRRRKTMHRRK